MQQYAEADICRRRILLSYFERQPQRTAEIVMSARIPSVLMGQSLYKKALSAIARAEQQIGTGLLIDILRGSYSAEVTAKGYQELKTFGVGRDIPSRLARLPSPDVATRLF